MSVCTIAAGSDTYTWNSQWAKLPSHIRPGRTHGVAVDKQGQVYVFNQSNYAMLVFDSEGNFIKSWDEFPSPRFANAHGLTLVNNNGDEYFWLTDQKSGEVVKTTLEGETVLEIAKPDHEAYEDSKYAPTWVAESPADGDVYVADGYGSSLIHHYDLTGTYIDSLDGTTGAGRFSCPHSVWIGSRPKAVGTDEPVLYVTDRANSRVQVYKLDGTFIKEFSQNYPCCFAEHEGKLLVPDLHAFINIYDERDQLIAEHLGDNREVVEQREANRWPNVQPQLREEGKFNSPHGGCFDSEGNIYIVEWISDGRIIKLTREG